MRPEKGLPRFRETKYPHHRSEGTSNRWNRGLRELEEIRVKYEEGQEDCGFVEDGFGSAWPRCSPDCTLEVVRPGKVQCQCEWPEEEANLAPTPTGDVESDQ